jgi:hypothetical protein
MIVVTDGESTCTSLTKKAAQLAITNEIKMFALGIGHGFDKELNNIVGGENASIVQIFNFTMLDSTILKNVSNLICKNGKIKNCKTLML